MRTCATLTSALTVLVLLSAAPQVFAQSSATDKAAAEGLFEEGKQLLDQGKYDQACGKFAASQQLDAGIGTLLFLAECYEKSGKTASAWATFKEAAAAARAQGQGERETLARSRADTLEKQLSKLRVHAAPELMNLPGLEVRLNGTAVSMATWGSAVPVDPGPQKIEAMAPGYEAWSTTIAVPAAGGETPLDIPALKKSAAPAPGAAPAAAPGTAANAEQDSGSDGSGQRLLGFVGAGLGLAVIGAGTFFGLKAMSKNDDSLKAENCRTPKLCTPTGLALRSDAEDAASSSTIAFVAGGVLFATGVTLILTAPSSKSSSETSHYEPAKPQLELGAVWLGREGGVNVRGSF